MKKIVLVILVALISLNLFSQINKGDVLISVDGNYMKTTTETGVTTNQNVNQAKNLNLGISVGYFISSRFVAGIGLDYYWNKEVRNNIVHVTSTFTQGEIMNIKSDAFLPNVYLAYYIPVTKNLYFNTKLKCSLSNIKSEFNTYIASSKYQVSDTLISPGSDLGPSLTSRSGKSEVDYFSVELAPEMTYFISPKFSVCLGLGGIGYAMADWKTDNSNWMVNFNPIYWSLGVKIKI